MERLTKRMDSFSYALCGNVILAKCENCQNRMDSCYEEDCGVSVEALKRLAAYEDTGLEPEEINEALREKQEREKGCVWCNENNKVFHDGQHFHLFCSYCGKRLEVEHE